MTENEQDSQKNVNVAEERVQKIVNGAVNNMRYQLQDEGMGDAERSILIERLTSMDIQMDDRGWKPLFFNITDEGPALPHVKAEHKKISDLLAAPQSWIKRGLSLRYSYVWKDGIRYGRIPKTTDGRARAKNVQGFIDKPINQKNFFGTSARQQREASLYTAGLALYIGNDGDKTMKPFPVSQIDADYRNPEDASEIWAYRRTWSYYAPGEEAAKTKALWYFTNLYWDRRVNTIKYGSENELVSKSERVFGGAVNTQMGWGYGVADAAAAVPWIKLYRDFLINGYTVTAAMAQIWAVAKQSSKAGADNASISLGTGGVGQTAVMSKTNELTPLSTAGQAYDFSKGIQLAAAAASSIEISAIALLSDTSAAGGSYGSAQTLDLPTRLAMESRRAFHIDLDTEVLKWMGAEDPDVYFLPFDDATDQYRKVQALILSFSQGLYTADQMVSLIDDVFGVSTADKMPPGIIIPNTKAALAATNPAPTAVQAASPDQGKNNGTGNETGGNDQRNDTLSK